MYKPLSEAFFTVTSETVLPLPSNVSPLPLLPDVDAKSIVALFFPDIFTPDGTFIASDFIVPLITIVVPDFALLIAAERVVPPFFTSKEFVVFDVEPALSDELPELLELLLELLPVLLELLPVLLELPALFQEFDDELFELSELAEVVSNLNN